MELGTVYTHLNELLTQPRMRTLYQQVREVFKSREYSAHNWEHVRRVILNSVYIGVEEKADMNVVLPAAILHDLGYATNPDDPPHHPQNGAKKCFPYLSAWTDAEQKAISNCILKHKGAYPGFDQVPETLNEKVVCDADQVDKFGWIGFLQLLKVYIEHGRNGIGNYNTLPGLAEAMTHIGDIQLYTATAMRIARHMIGPDLAEASRDLKDDLAFYEGWTEPF